MGKEQELFDAARSGNATFIEKTLNQKNKWAFPVPLPSQLTTTLRKGIHPNIQDTNGETPLHHASLNGHRNVVELLLKLQASTNIPDQKGCFPLHLASWRGNAEICHILLTHGPSIAKVNAQNQEGDAALHTAAQYGHVAVVSLLLQNQADPAIRNKKWETALDLACQYGRLDTVQLLLAGTRSQQAVGQGPASTGSQWTINGPSTRDKSPLHLAARSGHRNVVQTLLDAGFDINHKTEDGSALHEASLYGRIDVVRLLLERGIDVSILDCANKTALAIVSDQKTIKSQEIETILRDHIFQSLNTRQVAETEATYEQVKLPRPVAHSQPGSAAGPSNRDSVTSSDSSAFDFTSAFRQNIPSVDSEEESIYDRPSTQLRVVIPSIDCSKSPLSSSSWHDSVPSRSPGTPKKPPRKKLTPGQTQSVMVKGSGSGQTGVSSSSEDQFRATTNYGESAESSVIVSHGNGDNNNDIMSAVMGVNNSVEILTNAEIHGGAKSAPSLETSRTLADDNDVVRAVNNNNQSQTAIEDVNFTAAPPATTLHTAAVDGLNTASHSSGRLTNARPVTVADESVINQRPPGLNMTSKRSTCVAAPSSPTHYNQPPTPEHPPPSPMTAILGIQEKINPRDRRRSHDMETITESEFLGGTEFLAVSDLSTAAHSGSRTVPKSSDEVSADNRKQHSRDEDVVCVATSDTDPFLGLTKGSAITAGVHRRSSDSKVTPAVARFQKHDGAANRSAKRVSAPPGMIAAGFRPPCERLQPLSETVSGVSSEQNSRRAVNTKSICVDNSVNQSVPEQTSSSIVDEMDEWGKIGDILTSLGDMLVRPNSGKQLSPALVRSLTEDDSIRSVGDWLADLSLSQYENTLVANGYDNVDFMGADVLDENDLLEIGILSSDHRQRILDAASTLPLVPASGHSLLKSWLDCLHLSEYLDCFTKNKFADRERIMKIWDVDLNALTDISRLGHRRRIAASLKAESVKRSSHCHENTASTDSGRHPDFAELDQLMNWNGPLLQAEKVCDAPAMRCKEPSEHHSSANTNGNAEDDPSSASHWRHRPESLIKGRCNYTAQYLGSTLVAFLEGTESTKSSICRLKKSTQNIAKVPSIILSISYKGVKFIDPSSKQVICEHEIGNIFCACQDADDLNVFAYITRDLSTDKHYCHVFSVYSTALATEIILTLGEAFEVAYQVALRENSAEAAAASSVVISQDNTVSNAVPAGRKKQSYSTAI